MRRLTVRVARAHSASICDVAAATVEELCINAVIQRPVCSGAVLLPLRFLFRILSTAFPGAHGGAGALLSITPPPPCIANGLLPD